MDEPHPVLPITERALELTLHREPLQIEADSGLSWILGMLGRSRRQLRVMTILDASGARDCEEGLVRSVFEHFSTAIWLMDGDDRSFEAFLRAHRRDLRLLSDGRPERYKDWLDHVTEVVEDEYGDGTREMQLPPFDQRGPDIVRMRYWMYRELSIRAHAGVLSSLGYVVQRPVGWSMQEVAPTGDMELAYLPYATFMVAGLGALVFQDLEPPRSADLKSVMGDLVEYHLSDRPGGWVLG